MRFLRLFRPLDYPVMALSACLALLSLVSAASSRGKASVLVVTSPSGEWRFSLEKDTTAGIPGELGDSVIVIEDGKARFADSPCKNKVCVLHSPLTSGGHWSACLPNRVMLRVEGASGAGIDVMTN